jgi:hypothetical protein
MRICCVKYCDYVVTKKDKLLEKQRVTPHTPHNMRFCCVKYCDYVVTKKDKLLEKQRVSGGGIPPTPPTI